MAYIELNVSTVTSTRNASNANGLRIVSGFAKRLGIIAPDFDLSAATEQEQQDVMDLVANEVVRHMTRTAKSWEVEEAAEAARQAAINDAGDWVP